MDLQKQYDLLSKAFKTKRNTRVYKYERYVSVVLHGTEIAICTEKSIRLNAGSFHTKTTKDRMNQILKILYYPAYLWQEKFVWYLAAGTDVTVLFANGIGLKR